MGKTKAQCCTRVHVKKRPNPETDLWDGKKLAPKQRLFLAAYARCGLIGLAAESAKLHRNAHARWLKGGEAYRKAFEDSRERAIEAMESEARRRAVEGVQEAVWYEGTKCGTRQRYSDPLLMFLLKAARPDTYAERAQVAMDVRHQIAEQFPELARPGRAAAKATLEAARAAGAGRHAGKG